MSAVFQWAKRSSCLNDYRVKRWQRTNRRKRKLFLKSTKTYFLPEMVYAGAGDLMPELLWLEWFLIQDPLYCYLLFVCGGSGGVFYRRKRPIRSLSWSKMSVSWIEGDPALQVLRWMEWTYHENSSKSLCFGWNLFVLIGSSPLRGSLHYFHEYIFDKVPLYEAQQNFEWLLYFWETQSLKFLCFYM